jgi:hypothetical protein
MRDFFLSKFAYLILNFMCNGNNKKASQNHSSFLMHAILYLLVDNFWNISIFAVFTFYNNAIQYKQMNRRVLS